MRYLILTDHPLNDLRVSKSQKYLKDSKTLQVPSFLSKFFWIPGYPLLISLITYFYRFDALYCHDLFLSYAGIKRKGKKTYCDLHENFYDHFNHARFKYKFIGWFFRKKRIQKMLSRVIKDGVVITVSRGIADSYDTKYYYPNVSSPTLTIDIIKFRTYDKNVFVFVGRNRELENIDWSIFSGSLFIYSKDNIDCQKITDSANGRIDVTQYKDFHGNFIPINGIGLLPNKYSLQSIDASPNKLFTYLNSGIPVVCSDYMREVVRVLDKYDCGYYAETIEKAMMLAIKDVDGLGEKAGNARKAVFEYNEDNLVKPLFDQINKLYI